jgi:glycosyltransferase involved in cell wall biosynthesis
MTDILLITTKYRHDNGSPWLVSELAEELVSQGSNVTVLNLDWQSTREIKRESAANPRVLNFEAGRFLSGLGGLLLKWGFSSFKLVPFILMQWARGKKYDLLISFSPCTALHVAIYLANKISRKSSLIYWDIFPLHNQAIGRSIPVRLLPALKKVERNLVNLFGFVGCMGEGNRSAFLNYFSLCGDKVKIMPIWTSTLKAPVVDKFEVRRNYGIPSEALVFVFGGQLVAGRGIENICKAFHRLATEIDNVVLVFCGSGPLTALIEKYQAISRGQIHLIRSLPRNEYLKILVSADIGVVSAISDKESSSFPSKSLDYFACSLPIFAILEEKNDLGVAVTEKMMGLVCNQDDCNAIFTSLRAMIERKSDFSDFGRNGNFYLNSEHSVSKVVGRFIEMSNV